MTPHEQIMISAERYALGRRTYIVSDTTKYIAKHINGMTDHCRQILINDISDPLYGSYGDECDKEEWMWLLDELENTIEVCVATGGVCCHCKPYCSDKVLRKKEK